MSVPDREREAAAPALRPRPGHLSRGALVVPAALLVLGVLLVVGIATMDVVGEGGLFGPTAMPWAVAVLCFVTGAVLAADILRPRPGYEPVLGPRSRAAAVPADDDGTPADTVDARAVVIAVGGVVAFIVLLPWLGWILSATLLFTAVAVALGNRRVGRCLLAGLALASVIQIVFSGLLGIALPPGFVGGF